MLTLLIYFKIIANINLPRLSFALEIVLENGDNVRSARSISGFIEQRQDDL